MHTNNLKVGSQEDGVRLLLWCSITMQGAMDTNQSICKFYLDMGKNFLTLRVKEHRNSLPREVVECPALEIFQSHLNATLCNLFL